MIAQIQTPSQRRNSSKISQGGGTLINTRPIVNQQPSVYVPPMVPSVLPKVSTGSSGTGPMSAPIPRRPIIKPRQNRGEDPLSNRLRRRMELKNNDCPWWVWVLLGLLLLLLLIAAVVLAVPRILNKDGWFGKNSVFGEARENRINQEKANARQHPEQIKSSSTKQSTNKPANLNKQPEKTDRVQSQQKIDQKTVVIDSKISQTSKEIPNNQINNKTTNQLNQKINNQQPLNNIKQNNNLTNQTKVQTESKTIQPPTQTKNNQSQMISQQIKEVQNKTISQSEPLQKQNQKQQNEVQQSKSESNSPTQTSQNPKLPIQQPKQNPSQTPITPQTPANIAPSQPQITKTIDISNIKVVQNPTALNPRTNTDNDPICSDGFFLHNHRCIKCPPGSSWNGSNCIKRKKVQVYVFPESSNN